MNNSYYQHLVVKTVLLTRRSSPALPNASFSVDTSTLLDSCSVPACVGWRERGAAVEVEVVVVFEVVAVTVAGVVVWY